MYMQAWRSGTLVHDEMPLMICTPSLQLHFWDVFPPLAFLQPGHQNHAFHEQSIFSSKKQVVCIFLFNFDPHFPVRHSDWRNCPLFRLFPCTIFNRWPVLTTPACSLSNDLFSLSPCMIFMQWPLLTVPPWSLSNAQSSPCMIFKQCLALTVPCVIFKQFSVLFVLNSQKSPSFQTKGGKSDDELKNVLNLIQILFFP